MRFIPILILLSTAGVTAQDTLTAVYSISDIPTSYLEYDSSCTGPATTLSVTLPAGDYYMVTGMDINYSMTALGAGWKSQQRSQVLCQLTGLDEPVYSGVGDEPGTENYFRQGVYVSNGIYAGGTEITFEMRAWRTFEGVPGCNASTNRVNAVSWIISVYYGADVPGIGINTSTASQVLDVNGKIQVGDDSTPPGAGTIRWNTGTQNFEGYDGTIWVSLTDYGHGNRWGNETLIQRSSTSGSGGGASDYFGREVEISGDYAVIGARRHNTSGNADQGKAYIFKRINGTTWSEEDTLIASDGAALDYFGGNVGIHGDYAIVGAYGHNTNGNADQGKAYIFKRNGSEWSEQSILISSDGDTDDYFGASVAIYGDFACVGAAEHDVAGNLDQGQVYVFHRDGIAWTEVDVLSSSDGAAGDNFGWSVDIFEDDIIVGAQSHDTGGNMDQGKVYLFRRDSITWIQDTTLTAPDGAEGDVFGWAVAISADRAIVGAPYHYTEGDSLRGKAYIFERDSTEWSEVSVLVSNDGVAEDNFGWSVSIDGKSAGVSSPRHNTNGNFEQGKAYLFSKNNAIWYQEAIFIASDGEANDWFGSDVGLSGVNAIIGARAGGNVNQGKVYFFGSGQ